MQAVSSVVQPCDRTIRFGLLDDSLSDFLNTECHLQLLLFVSRQYSNSWINLVALYSMMKNYSGKISAGVCLVEDAPVICSHFNIDCVPTLIALAHDYEVGRFVGIRSQDECERLVDRWLGLAGRMNKLNESIVNETINACAGVA